MILDNLLNINMTRYKITVFVNDIMPNKFNSFFQVQVRHEAIGMNFCILCHIIIEHFLKRLLCLVWDHHQKSPTGVNAGFFIQLDSTHYCSFMTIGCSRRTPTFIFTHTSSKGFIDLYKCPRIATKLFPLEPCLPSCVTTPPGWPGTLDAKFSPFVLLLIQRELSEQTSRL